MLKAPKYVKVRFPADVCSAVNWCIAMLTRSQEIVFEDRASPEVLQDDRRVRIALPYYQGGGVNNGFPGGFKCVRYALEDSVGIRVHFGTVNSIVPDGMNLGDVPPYVLTPTGSGMICLGVNVDDDGFAESAFITTTVGAPVDTTFVKYQALGSFATVDGELVVTPGGDGNGIGDQSFELCGGLGGDSNFGRA